MLNKMFKTASEKDIGQVTNNPYVLAKRHFDSNNETDIHVLNSVLAYHGLSVTVEEFDIIQSLKPVSLPYPLPNNDTFVHTVVGPTTKRKSDMVAGTYVLTLKDSLSKQYVGGSTNLSTRLRTYYNTKAKVSGRTMAVIMSKLGPTSFNLGVYVIPFDKFTTLPLTDTYKSKLVLAVEQYFILHLKPVLNDMLVVGGGQTKNLGSTQGMIQYAATINYKMLYVYDINKNNLLYISPSRIDFQEKIGMNTKTQWKHIVKSDPIFDTYYLTESPIEGVNTALMTTHDLRTSMDSLYLSNKGPKHPVKLTDLLAPVSDQPKIFTSKTELLKHIVSLKRPVKYF